MGFYKIPTNEFASFYGTYINLLASGVPLLELLRKNSDTLNFFSKLPLEKLEYRYAEGKWTLKEVFLHVIDTERIMAYRALCFARKDRTALPGFEQDEYVFNSNVNNRTIESLLDEYKSVRMSTISLFSNFNEEEILRTGIANGSIISVRALGAVIYGHEMHHLHIAKERYI